jgi:manganese/iron transport system permease protein
VALFYKEFLFYTFDPLAAQAIGLPVGWIHLGLTAAITLTIIASMQAVGVVLVISLLVGPSITAYLLVKELHWMMAVGAVFGIISSISGMYISYYSNIPSGAAIVLVVSGLFFLALLFSPSQGILTRPETANRSKRLLRQLTQLKQGKEG